MSWQKQLEELKIPYPRKLSLKREISAHLAELPEEGEFEAENLAELYELHNTVLFKALVRLPAQARATIECSFALVPMMGLAIFLWRENFMIDFIRQGGAAMYVLLAIGGSLIARELLLLIRILVIKDHSPSHLKLDTPTVVIGVAALILLGVGATSLDAYHTVQGYLNHAERPAAILIEGFAESVTCLVLSSVLAAMVLIIHFVTRRTLKAWCVPAV